jgi:tetratricopeptide (TPR) repeat protein
MKNLISRQQSSLVLATTILLSLLTVGLNVNSAIARLTVDSADRIQTQTSLAQINDEDEDEEEPQVDNSSKKKSQLYYKRGVEAQGGDDNKAAFAFYKKALELDTSNSHAWLGLGTVLCSEGEIQPGIKALKIAAKLLKSEGDDDCYEIAISWLKKFRNRN